MDLVQSPGIGAKGLHRNDLLWVVVDCPIRGQALARPKRRRRTRPRPILPLGLRRQPVRRPPGQPVVGVADPHLLDRNRQLVLDAPAARGSVQQSAPLEVANLGCALLRRAWEYTHQPEEGQQNDITQLHCHACSASGRVSDPDARRRGTQPLMASPGAPCPIDPTAGHDQPAASQLHLTHWH